MISLIHFWMCTYVCECGVCALWACVCVLSVCSCTYVKAEESIPDTLSLCLIPAWQGLSVVSWWAASPSDSYSFLPHSTELPGICNHPHGCGWQEPRFSQACAARALTHWAFSHTRHIKIKMHHLDYSPLTSKVEQKGYSEKLFIDLEQVIKVGSQSKRWY